jgi:hypothetical protein
LSGASGGKGRKCGGRNVKKRTPRHFKGVEKSR